MKIASHAQCIVEPREPAASVRSKGAQRSTVLVLRPDQILALTNQFPLLQRFPTNERSQHLALDEPHAATATYARYFALDRFDAHNEGIVTACFDPQERATKTGSKEGNGSP